MKPQSKEAPKLGKLEQLLLGGAGPVFYMTASPDEAEIWRGQNYTVLECEQADGPGEVWMIKVDLGVLGDLLAAAAQRTADAIKLVDDSNERLALLQRQKAGPRKRSATVH